MTDDNNILDRLRSLLPIGDYTTIEPLSSDGEVVVRTKNGIEIVCNAQDAANMLVGAFVTQHGYSMFDRVGHRIRCYVEIGAPDPVAHTGAGATPIDAIVAAIRAHRRP